MLTGFLAGIVTSVLAYRWDRVVRDTEAMLEITRDLARSVIRTLRGA